MQTVNMHAGSCMTMQAVTMQAVTMQAVMMQAVTY